MPTESERLRERQRAPLYEQTARALLGLRLGIGPVPVVLLIVTGLVLLRYPINRSAHEAVKQQLAVKQPSTTSTTAP